MPYLTLALAFSESVVPLAAKVSSAARPSHPTPRLCGRGWRLPEAPAERTATLLSNCGPQQLQVWLWVKTTRSEQIDAALVVDLIPHCLLAQHFRPILEYLLGEPLASDLQ